LKGPEGWETAEITEVLYEDRPAASVSAPAPPAEDGGGAFTCAALCKKANSVPPCKTNSQEIAPCTELCEGGRKKCKEPTEALFACARTAAFKCKPEGDLDFGACTAAAKAWEACLMAN
jgi:hypothetical protein